MHREGEGTWVANLTALSAPKAHPSPFVCSLLCIRAFPNRSVNWSPELLLGMLSFLQFKVQIERGEGERGGSRDAT